MGRTLFVGGISSTTRLSDLRYEFERFGRLSRCDMPMKGGRPGGFAFVEYEDDRDADEAFDRMQNARIDGRVIGLQV
jgi:RNA recognition motif-containing protein